MIPEHWETVRRPDDDEVVGYLVPTDGTDAVPTSLVGTALAHTRTATAARTLLLTDGLRALDRRWWCRLPASLPPGLLDAARPEEDWDWRAVVVVEVGPDGAVVRPEWPEPSELTAQAALPVPVGELLCTEPPA